MTIDFPGGKHNRRIDSRAQLKILKCNAIMMKTNKHVKMKFQFNSNVSSLETCSVLILSWVKPNWACSFTKLQEKERYTEIPLVQGCTNRDLTLELN